MPDAHAPKPSATGEVAGAFLLGLIEAFSSLMAISEDEIGIDASRLSPTEWYPYALLTDTFERIERVFPNSENLFFQAGTRFMRIWYEHGPGKTMIHSARDWLYANSDGAGYNTVVRGGSKEEIGWSRLLAIDEEQGFAVYENVTPLKLDFVKGVFYGGCLLFDDMDFVRVAGETEPYPANLAFSKLKITLHFHLKDAAPTADLAHKIDAFDGHGTFDLTPQEIRSLAWR